MLTKKSLELTHQFRHPEFDEGARVTLRAARIDGSVEGVTFEEGSGQEVEEGPLIVGVILSSGVRLLLLLRYAALAFRPPFVVVLEGESSKIIDEWQVLHPAQGKRG